VLGGCCTVDIGYVMRYCMLMREEEDECGVLYLLLKVVCEFISDI